MTAGNADALGAAGRLYFAGVNSPPDYALAAQCFQQSADLGDGYSLKFLAAMYERGLLEPPDPAKAAALRERAKQLDPDSLDPDSPDPGVPASVRAPPRQARRGSGGDGRPAGPARPAGAGTADANANDPRYTGTVHVNRWNGVATRLPRCWPFCTVQ